MGERHNGTGSPDRHRTPSTAASASGAVSGHGADPVDAPAFEALLAGALRAGHVDAEGERRAVAAFRAARAAGVRPARTRRRDDWRPRERRRGSRSLKGALSVVLASLTLGGVAFAAIGTAGSGPDDAGDRPVRPHPSATGAQVRPGTVGPAATDSPAPSVSAPASADRPATAKDTEAHCRAYEQVQGRGKALDATAWQRLLTAAGGEANVRAYCAARLAGATAETEPAEKGEPDNTGKGAGSGAGAGTGASGNPGNGRATEKAKGKKN